MTRVSVFAAVLAGVIGPQAPASPPAAAKPFALELALDAAQAALASCQAAGAPAVVEVMDTAFNPKVVLAADGSRANLIEFARRKAYTVIKTGMTSAEFGVSVGPQGRGAPNQRRSQSDRLWRRPADQDRRRDRCRTQRVRTDRPGGG